MALIDRKVNEDIPFSPISCTEGWLETIPGQRGLFNSVREDFPAHDFRAL